MAEETTTATEPSSTETVATESTTTEETVETTSYLDGKYKSVGELEEGYRNLQSSYSKKLGGFTGSPEEYTFNEGIDAGNASDFIQTWGKENQLSNEGLNSLVEGFRESEAAAMESYRAEEVSKLGENATERIQNVTDWLTASVGQDAAEALNTAFPGAKGIEALEKLQGLTKNSAPATATPAPAVDKEKLDFMQFQEKDAHGNRRYASDPTFRSKVQKMREQLL